MISSMTGFGSAEGKVGGFAVSLEIRAVNHRFFNPSLKLPAAFSRWEGEVRELLRQSISRGHVTVTGRAGKDVSRGSGINEARFADYVAAIRELQSAHSLSEGLDAATILGLPDVITSQTEEQDTGSVAELLAIVEQAIAVLTEMRKQEGARLAVFLRERIGLVEAAVARIRDRAPIRLAEHTARMKRSVKELAGGANVDPQRLAQEIAILADKLDISEEIDRFESHISAFRETVDSSGDDPVGKRLGFLLQEMVREANTTGSKASDATVLADVVLIKEELERIREQVENVE